MYPLGRIQDKSLDEIWFGRRARALRSAMDDARFHLGCESCAPNGDDPDGIRSYARTFDGLSELRRSQWPVQLELALSNACNLQCLMCNGELSSAIRRHREHRPPLPKVYGSEFFDQLTPFLTHAHRLVFLGGEPFLSAEVRRVIRLLDGLAVDPSLHFTTNGTRLPAWVFDALGRYRSHVSVSIDSLEPERFSSIRVGAKLTEVLENLDRVRELVQLRAGGVSISFTLMTHNWMELPSVLDWAEGLGLEVNVNVCEFPAGASLFRLPRSELAAIISSFESATPSLLSRLRVNAGVWTRELDRLSAHLNSETPVRLGRDSAVGNRLDAMAEELAEASPGGPISRVDLDERLQITGLDISPSSLLHGLIVDGTVGAPIHSLPEAMERCFGEMTSSELHNRSDGTELRKIRFERGDREARVFVGIVPIERGDEVRMSILISEEVDTRPARSFRIG